MPTVLLVMLFVSIVACFGALLAALALPQSSRFGVCKLMMTLALVGAGSALVGGFITMRQSRGDAEALAASAMEGERAYAGALPSSVREMNLERGQSRKYDVLAGHVTLSVGRSDDLWAAHGVQDFALQIALKSSDTQLRRSVAIAAQ